MSNNLEQFLQEYPVVLEFPVQWGDMDALQHVNNTVYFRYFENVRIAYMGRTSVFNDIQRLYPVLAETDCRYRKPVNFPDTLTVGCRTSELQDSGFVQTYAVFSQTQDTVTTTGSARIVLIDAATGRRAELTEKLRQEIDAVEQRATLSVNP